MVKDTRAPRTTSCRSQWRISPTVLLKIVDERLDQSVSERGSTIQTEDMSQPSNSSIRQDISTMKHPVHMLVSEESCELTNEDRTKASAYAIEHLRPCGWNYARALPVVAGTEQMTATRGNNRRPFETGTHRHSDRRRSTCSMEEYQSELGISRTKRPSRRAGAIRIDITPRTTILYTTVSVFSHWICV